MDFKLKTRLFEYFGRDAKVRDTFKDVNGKGISERYHEALGEGYDDDVSDLLDNFIDRTIVPKEMVSQLIPLMEWMLGSPVVVTDAVAMRRRIIQFAQQIYNIKSTALSYEILLRMLGFDTVTIQEFVITSGFDSDVTFDDEIRAFDGADNNCAAYSVLLTGSITVTDAVNDAVFRIIAFLEPVNADLRQVLYNGSPITPVSGDIGIFDSTFDSTFE